ncbi:unnamed protein product [Prorocentrum cordatum]|uniref:Uncharacterized protein n=1 Tax=Prorocentrum cordatum TaxID=2364126 RepID=A0ABN9RP67_9DINO|nr:unnamed protein product [Polarella glacialis]
MGSILLLWELGPDTGGPGYWVDRGGGHWKSPEGERAGDPRDIAEALLEDAQLMRRAAAAQHHDGTWPKARRRREFDETDCRRERDAEEDDLHRILGACEERQEKAILAGAQGYRRCGWGWAVLETTCQALCPSIRAATFGPLRGSRQINNKSELRAFISSLESTEGPMAHWADSEITFKGWRDRREECDHKTSENGDFWRRVRKALRDRPSTREDITMHHMNSHMDAQEAEDRQHAISEAKMGCYEWPRATAHLVRTRIAECTKDAIRSGPDESRVLKRARQTVMRHAALSGLQGRFATQCPGPPPAEGRRVSFYGVEPHETHPLRWPGYSPQIPVPTMDEAGTGEGTCVAVDPHNPKGEESPRGPGTAARSSSSTRAATTGPRTTSVRTPTSTWSG